MRNKFKIINDLKISPHKQCGAALILMAVVLLVTATTILVTSLSSASFQINRATINSQALAQAKEALLGYAITHGDPGELPCPDTNNDGYAESSCGNGSGSTGQNQRLGRLPWKTLGLPDLRDSSGERLWYAVSSNFKNNTRYYPLNSDTLGTITLRASDNTLLSDGSSNTGLAAIIIAPGTPLQRTDQTTLQDRSTTGNIIANNYLEIAYGEDNANFTDNQTNGFIQGPIKDVSERLILNDVILPITRENISQAMQRRVLSEVRNALNAYYVVNHKYPMPANFTDQTCLGNGDLGSYCLSDSNRYGRMPANPSGGWTTNLLKGVSTYWFQHNAWREVIFYAVANACSGMMTMNCNGSGFLTLNHPPATPATNQKFILIATGSSMSTQARASNTDKTTLNNYLEGENLSTGNDIYTSSDAAPFNDTAIGY